MYIRVFVSVGLLFLSLSNSCSFAPAKQDDVLIEYHRSGGFAGLDDQLTILTDGRAQLKRRSGEREFTIEPGQLEQLRELISGLNVRRLSRKTRPTGRGADLFYYQLSIAERSIRMDDLSIPEPLLPLLAILDTIMQTPLSPPERNSADTDSTR